MRVGDTEVRLVGIDRQQQQHRSRGAPGLRLPPFPPPFLPPLSAAISRAWAFVPGMDGTVPKSVRDPLVPVASILTVLRKRARVPLVWSGLAWPGLSSGLARTIYRSPRKYAECRLPCGKSAERDARKAPSKFFIESHTCKRDLFVSWVLRRRQTKSLSSLKLRYFIVATVTYNNP